MTLRTSPSTLPRPRDAAGPALGGQPRRHWAPLAVQLAAGAIGLVAIGAYLYVALRRLDYPFALERLEGNSLIEVHRIVTGQPLYPAPTAQYVPDGYPPLYFYVSAAVARVFGVSYLSLRLVSLASSLACFGLLARLVQRETGSIAAGIGAAGVFAGTYFVAGAWFDLGRVDSLFLALSIGALYAARWMRGMPGAIVAGTLLAAAALTKQTGLAELVVVPGVLLLGPRRGLARVAGLTAIAVVGVCTVALRFTTGGWYTYYIFKQMSEHSLADSNFTWFWTALATATGLAACAALIGARRVPREFLAGCAALAIEGYVALMASGGTINDVLPAYLAVALLAGLALGSRSSRWVTTLSGALIVAQSLFLMAASHPSQALPTSADRAVGAKLLAGVRALGGDVADPDEPSLSLLAGMQPIAHPSAVYDVLRATDEAGIESYTGSAAKTAAAKQFSAIISDGPGAPFNGPHDLLQNYRECVQPLPTGPATVLVPVAGGSDLPAVVWIPRDGRSCQAVFSILDGGKETHS